MGLALLVATLPCPLCHVPHRTHAHLHLGLRHAEGIRQPCPLGPCQVLGLLKSLLQSKDLVPREGRACVLLLVQAVGQVSGGCMRGGRGVSAWAPRGAWLWAVLPSPDTAPACPQPQRPQSPSILRPHSKLKPCPGFKASVPCWEGCAALCAHPTKPDPGTAPAAQERDRFAELRREQLLGAVHDLRAAQHQEHHAHALHLAGCTMGRQHKRVGSSPRRERAAELPDPREPRAVPGERKRGCGCRC